MTAIRSVIVMQERIATMQKSIDRISASVDGLDDYTTALDKRLVRIETMIEMSRAAPPPSLPGAPGQ